jgi:hypothetical protein
MDMLTTDFRSEFKLVTPAQAKEWLSNTRPNRPISKASVEPLTRKILAGTLPTSNQPISFDMQGRLADGQHRVQAIADSNIATWLRCDYNVPDDVLDHCIDSGRARSLSDKVKILGGQASQKKTACIRALISLERNYVKPDLAMYMEAVEVLGEEHLEEVCSRSSQKIPSALSAAALYARPLDPQVVDHILDAVASRSTAAGTEKAIENLTVHRKDFSLKAYTKAFMDGMLCILKGIKREHFRTDSDGYPKLMHLRDKAGLPTLLFPKTVEQEQEPTVLKQYYVKRGETRSPFEILKTDQEGNISSRLCFDPVLDPKVSNKKIRADIFLKNYIMWSGPLDSQGFPVAR